MNNSTDFWIPAAVRYVMTNERSSYGSFNANTDGQGVSYGILQATQKSGALGRLLVTMYEADPVAFVRVFGAGNPSTAASLISTTTSDTPLAPVGGVVLWAEPWKSRFKAAAEIPAFQAAQHEYAASSSFARETRKIAAMLGIESERGWVLIYDTTINPGPGAAMGFAKKIAANPPATEDEVLQLWATLRRNRYYRPATSPPDNPSGWTQRVDGSWLKTKSYDQMVNRNNRILMATDLGDAPGEQYDDAVVQAEGFRRGWGVPRSGEGWTGYPSGPRRLRGWDYTGGMDLPDLPDCPVCLAKAMAQKRCGVGVIICTNGHTYLPSGVVVRLPEPGPDIPPPSLPPSMRPIEAGAIPTTPRRAWGPGRRLGFIGDHLPGPYGGSQGRFDLNWGPCGSWAGAPHIEREDWGEAFEDLDAPMYIPQGWAGRKMTIG